MRPQAAFMPFFLEFLESLELLEFIFVFLASLAFIKPERNRGFSFPSCSAFTLKRPGLAGAALRSSPHDELGCVRFFRRLWFPGSPVIVNCARWIDIPQGNRCLTGQIPHEGGVSDGQQGF